MAYRPAREGNLLSLYINNRAGGLIFHRDFSPNAAKLDTNEQMQLASTFSGLALIMGQLAPSRPSSGMQLLEADGGRTSTAGHPAGQPPPRAVLPQAFCCSLSTRPLASNSSSRRSPTPRAST
mmetsp:Transcript_17132/g.57679  ORF Transcript_17132/g.57679 Transcript_17132/m.57679 type:complete len:123 (+) Transcript_17132:60-428(+)